MDANHCSKTCFLLILVLHIKCILACPSKFGVYRYGSNCAFSCNCKTTAEQCNATTGECLASGCADGWIGSGCRFADIKLNGENSRHSDNTQPHRYSIRALNGNPDDCSITADTPTYSGRFWRAWLPVGTQQIVRGVILRTMTNKTGFFQGFEFFVDVADGELAANIVNEQHCHKQSAISPVTSPVIEVFCDNGPLIGNQIRFVLLTNGAQLVLCDVHAYGECQENVCGKLCNTACHCQEPVSAADKLSGLCSNGCTGRWTSADGTDGLCNKECNTSQWGPSCSRRCGYCRDGSACNVTSGTCPSGCDQGYTGLFCNESCSKGKYGTGCSNNCSGHCKTDGYHCNHTDGSCLDGCEAGWEGSTCDQACSSKSGIYRYGSNCEFYCNCKNTTEQCDVVTGECHMSGCADGWIGPGCRFDDIKLNSDLSRHSDNQDPLRLSYRALNGNPEDCSMTSFAQNNIYRFWRTWLPEGTNQIVKGVILRTMTNKPGFFRGFEFLVDVIDGPKLRSAPNLVNEQLCHKQSAISPVTTPVIEVFCDDGPLTGNQMRFVLSTKDAQLVLCDVHVYGECQENVCGRLCETACHCQEPDKVSGVCSNGCTGRWTSANGTNGLCNKECDITHWGPSCSRTCGFCQDGEACDVISGICPSSCESGYISHFCNKSCDDGKYGYDCAVDCGHCKTGPVCNKTNGVCPNNLCEDGWKGSKCNEHCPAGTYGTGCSSKCSGHCRQDGTICNHTTGGCREGCEAGWKSFICDTACEPGKWGIGCLHQCGYCWNGTCDAVTGYCATGCSVGYRNTSHCVAECADYFYGLYCQFECSPTCEVDVPCDKATGHCLSGCKPGLTGTLCNQVCESGFYGKDCHFTCSGHCVNNETCESVTGNCTNGCQSQFTGTRCDIDVLEQHQEPTSPTGPIAGGIVAAMIVIALVIVGIYLLRRRNQKKPSQTFRCRQENPDSNHTSFTSQHEERSTYDELNWNDNQSATNIGLEGVADVTNSPVEGDISWQSNNPRVTANNQEPTYINTTEQ